MTHTRNPAASVSVCVCVCLFGCATGQQVAHNVKTVHNNSNGNNMGKGNGDGNCNGSCLLRPGRKTMPGNEVHTCTHTCADACDMTSACFCILQQLTFAFIRSAAHVCVYGMHVCALHCESAARQSGLASGFEFRFQHGSSTFRVAYYCGNFMPFAPPGNPCKPPSSHATTSCLRAKLAR